jgi:hypothetical protein
MKYKVRTLGNVIRSYNFLKKMLLFLRMTL